jgi:hypothetical protein
MISIVPVVAQEPKPPVAVPADARHFNGKWYRAYLERVPWNRALERCKSLGGSLAIVPDAPTWQFVKELTPASVWLGATDEKAEGVWLWVDGTPLKYADWYPKQPDNAKGREHYLSTHKGQWNDAPRDGEHARGQFVTGFVCEWQKK